MRRATTGSSHHAPNSASPANPPTAPLRHTRKGVLLALTRRRGGTHARANPLLCPSGLPSWAITTLASTRLAATLVLERQGHRSPEMRRPRSAWLADSSAAGSVIALREESARRLRGPRRRPKSAQPGPRNGEPSMTTQRKRHVHPTKSPARPSRRQGARRPETGWSALSCQRRCWLSQRGRSGSQTVLRPDYRLGRKQERPARQCRRPAR